MKAWDERTPEQQIALLKSLIAYEERKSLTTPVRHPVSMEDVLPFRTRRGTVQLPSRRGSVSIPCVIADRKTALAEMDKLLKKLEASDAAQ